MQASTPAPKPRAVLPLTAPCGFPGCDDGAVSETAMCERHRRVAVSTTGSWLEAG